MQSWPVVRYGHALLARLGLAGALLMLLLYSTLPAVSLPSPASNSALVVVVCVPSHGALVFRAARHWALAKLRKCTPAALKFLVA